VNKTQIEWVKNPDGSQGYTHNPMSGCKNHTPEGLCLGGLFPCYADKLAHGRLRPLYEFGGIPAPNYNPDSHDPFYPRFWEERLKQPYQRKKPAGIFLDDMSDWMGDCWPREWTLAELQMMRENPQHRFYTLTKQPQRLPEFSPFPENCWVGVAVTSNDTYYPLMFTRERLFRRVKAANAARAGMGQAMADDLKAAGINWLIIGACTGTLREMILLCERYPSETLAVARYGNKFVALPKIEWVREIVEAADKAGVKVFLKDNLMPLFKAEGITSREDWTGIRQEMPE